MVRKAIKISSGICRMVIDMDIPTKEEFKITMFEALQDSARALETEGARLGSSGKFYKNWSGNLTKGIKATVKSYDKIKFFNNVKYAP